MEIEKFMDYTRVVRGNERVKLADVSALPPKDMKREQAEAEIEVVLKEVAELQELMYAANRHSLLIVLQGRDASGKDGTIRHVFGAMNPQGCRVASFKVPTAEELAHDFLWRIHKQTPERGQCVVFNRSQYEDVLVVRVHQLVAPEEWQKRYQHINDFERLLLASNTILIKFYLHITADEQRERLLAREAESTKYWKLSVGDWQERERWNEYAEAYEDAINKCASPEAAWHIVPANKKWFRNLAVARTVVDTLKPFAQGWQAELEAAGQAELAAVKAYRQQHEKTENG